MAGTNRTLKDLQDYAVKPPPGLFEKLWKRIRRLKPGDKMPAENISIPETNENTNNTALSEYDILTGLRSYTSAEKKPPPFDYQKLILAIAGKEKKVPDKKSFPLFYMTAAAAIAGIIILLFYFSLKKDKTAEPGIPFAQNDHSNISTQVPVQSNAQPVTAEPMFNRKNDHPEQYRKNALSLQAMIPKEKQDFYNDFIYSFTSFTYHEAKNFLKGLKKNKKISIDKYSYLNISDRMEDFLKDMYAINKKEKPTHKAKKLRSKLQKWKKKDEKYFDRKMEKNPLDIIDLSELILK